jgi:hypothetical protein
MCLPKDLEHWKMHSTWRVPPIILNIKSFQHLPSYAELGNHFQLIEGHTRLGYLLALESEGLLRATEHKVFLLEAKE